MALMSRPPQGGVERRLDEERWAAVMGRDRAADGAFVYAVATTRIYCRPSCPARRPRREHVRFFADPAAAARAGFRACKRCAPARAAGHAHTARVAAACRRIEAADEAPGLEELAAAAGLSPSHFHRVFKAATGVTPKAYAAAVRGERVRGELAAQPTVTAAIYGAGFGSSGRFYEGAAATLGMTPTAYRAGGAGETIRFALGECSLGSILVAASARGVCAIALGDDPGALLRELQDRFGRAELIGADPTFEGWVAKVVALVERPGGDLDLPLDVRGTAFQRRVWEALRAIPCGETRSYAQLAAALGAPRSTRAVARACATNALAVAIPCHRVVRSDGGLAGYRWGVERKAKLLAAERGAR